MQMIRPQVHLVHSKRPVMDDFIIIKPVNYVIKGPEILHLNFDVTFERKIF